MSVSAVLSRDPPIKANVKTYAITPQNDRLITLQVLNAANPGQSHTLRLPVNPATKTYTHDIRTTLTQTEGGAWIDDFGMGVPTLQLQGNTGWRALKGEYQHALVDGFQSWNHLYRDILQYFFALRKQAQNADDISFVVIDDADQVTYRVMPNQQLQLSRTSSSPLLFPYSITFIVLSSSLSVQGMQPLPDQITQIAGHTGAAQRKQLAQVIVTKAQTTRQPKPRTYTVQAGQDLSTIAQLFYGSGSLYPVIARANHLANPNLIYPGQVLTIPYTTIP